ncbi:MAG TPA: hypothetical protein VJN94_01515, partial [Candidatus Binataceae bacterium]|nr:hypothetical protein [Candidatus Binataceae bacterium]
MRYWPKRRFERILLWVAIVFVVYSVGTWLGVPALVRYIAQNQVAAALERRVSVGKVTFNPYKLRFNVLNLHIRGREPSEPFVDIARVDLRLSWTSIYRLALVVKEITVDGPSIHLVRTGPRTF